MTTVLGIDLSTSSTGFVALQATEKTLQPKLLHNSNYRPKEKAHRRQSDIMGAMIDLLNEFRPELVVIENYGMNTKHTSSIIPLIEIGGLVRYMLVQYDYEYRATSPSEHKEFVTGSGAGTGKVAKQRIMTACAQRWGFVTKNSDQADAYGLAVMGLAVKGKIMQLTQREREILGNMKASNIA